jgi:serine/threonine-protein kinase
MLFVREVHALEARLLSGTEGARDPFFSPDGQWVGFFADSKLKRIALAGGPPIVVAEAAQGRGAAWIPGDLIVYSPNSNTGLYEVPASGGVPQPASTLNADIGEVSHRWPHRLPGGRALLITIWSGSTDSAALAVLSLETHEIAHLVRGAAQGMYAPSGHVVYVNGDGVMLAAPVDLSSGTLTGAPVPVLDSVMVNVATAAAEFSLSADGSLAYLTGASEGALVLVNREGAERILSPRTERLRWPDTPRFSPDGRYVAYTASERPDPDVWVYDVQQSSVRRLSFDGNNVYPEWSPDGQWLGFSSAREGSLRRGLYRKRADGSGAAELLVSAQHQQWELTWSPDGRWLVYRETHPETARDIWKLDLERGDEPTPVLQTPSDEQAAVVSPNGRWLAYTSEESGRDEVYVQAFPAGTGHWQVSTDGGSEPRWSADGRELFYREGRRLLAVRIQTGEPFTASPPVALFDGLYYENRNHPAYDVHPNGREFVMIKAVEGSANLVIVLNWFEELKQRVGNGND